MKKNQVAGYFILLAYIIIVILYHLYGYIGHFGYDDIHYAELASKLLDGSIDFEDHYAYRLPVILFTAICYALFGISDFSSSLPALLITIAILLIVFNILREKGLLEVIIGLTLTTFSNWFLFYSDKLMPDIYVALAILAAIAIIHHYKYKSAKNHTALYAVLLDFSLLFGFLAKGTIVLAIPLLLYLVIIDLIYKRDLKFWLFSLLGGMALLALYLIVIWIFTGDLFKRFDAIASNSYLNLCSYDQQSLRILLKRIFLGFFELSIYQGLATGFIFVIAILFQKKAKSYFRVDDSFSFFLISAIILFLSSSFMTISPSSYAPMCLDPRHYLFLVPVAAIPASAIIADFVEHKKAAIQIILALFCVTILSFFLRGDTGWKLYLPLTTLFLIYFFIQKKRSYQRLFLVLFSAILLLLPLHMVSYAQKVKYRKQKEILVQQLIENSRDCVIITNDVQKRLLHYYSAFNKNESHSFKNFNDFDADTAIGGRKLLLLNWYTEYLSGLEMNDLPYYAQNISAANTAIFESQDPAISIYELKELTPSALRETALLSTFNDFERVVPFWSWKEKDISNKIIFEGSASNRISRFSSTFEYPLDSLISPQAIRLKIQTSLYCYAEDKTTTKIIVSLENSEGVYFWKALEINKYLKAYSNWWPVTFDVSIEKDDFRKGSSLKVYVLEDDRPFVYIDNFSIQILSQGL
jgi:hypothetical protein